MQLVQDLRYALRQCRAHPAFAATAVVMLALGLAANVAIFGFVDAALIKPLPYQDPSQLFTAFGTRPEAAPKQQRGQVSYLDFVDWRDRASAFRAIEAFDVRTGFTMSTAAGPQRVRGLRVSSGFFRALGVTPIHGREFRRDEEGPSAPPTVMISHSAWQTRFGGNPDVLGQTVTLQGEPHVLIGVLPADFLFPMADHSEFWTTIRGPQACWEVRGCRSLETIVRIADGVTPQAAAANLGAVIEDLRRQFPDPNPEVARLTPLRDVLLRDVRPILLVLLSGAALLLLIAAINVVNLLLARSDSRTREIAVRHALGASSSRLLHQFAMEALVLVAAGSAAGLMIAAWGMRLLASLLSADMIGRMPYLQGIGLNVRLIAFASIVSVAAAAIFALTPIVRLSMSSRAAGLKEGSRGSAGTTWRRFGASLVIAELAIALILLVGAGLLGKSFYRLLSVPVGFETRDLVLLGVSPITDIIKQSKAASAVSRHIVAQRIAERIAALPGVQSVGYAEQLPVGPGIAPASGFQAVGRTNPSEFFQSHPVRRISANYFKTLQAPLLRGREFTDAEVTATARVVIINDSAARYYFPGEDPIGKGFVIGTAPVREIVGVVSDIKDGPLEMPARPAAYLPFAEAGFSLAVRTSQEMQTLLPAMTAAINEVERGLLIGRPSTMKERIDRLPTTGLQRASAWVVGGFAGVAFLLSVIGLYGVVAYAVGQRTREIGVRMALGAERATVYQLVLGEAARLVGVGTVLGLAAAVGAATLMRRLLFSVESWDAPTLIASAAVLIASAMLASYIPARRAASVNPIEVLRAD